MIESMTQWIQRWFGTINPAVKFIVGVYLVARIFLSLWAFIISMVMPRTLQNLDLFGSPTVAVFDLTTNQRFAYSRLVDGAPLTFRLGEPGSIIDASGNVWSLADGRALSGTYVGKFLAPSEYSLEEIFPYHNTFLEQNPWLSVWQRFDANSYLAIAERGYANDFSVTLFPMYPLLIRIVVLIVGNEMLAALIVSNLAMIGALYFLYRLFEDWNDTMTLRRAMIYWLIFPTGFYLLAAYTEAPFLLFTLGAFYFARQQRWWLAGLIGAFAALTRLQGIALVLPLAFMVWRQSKSIQEMIKSGVWLGLIPFASLVFFLFTNSAIVSSYQSNMHAKFLMPWDNFLDAIRLLASGQGSFIDLTNLIIALIFLALLVPIWKKFSLDYVLYALLMYFVPLFRSTTAQPLVSTDRYVLAIFPAFLVLGVWGENPWVNRAVLYLSFPLQLYFIAQFVLWGWVG